MDCIPPGFSAHQILQQEYSSGLSYPPPGDLPDPGIEPASLMSLASAGSFFTPNATREALPYKSDNQSPYHLSQGGSFYLSDFSACASQLLTPLQSPWPFPPFAKQSRPTSTSQHSHLGLECSCPPTDHSLPPSILCLKLPFAAKTSPDPRWPFHASRHTQHFVFAFPALFSPLSIYRYLTCHKFLYVLSCLSAVPASGSYVIAMRTSIFLKEHFILYWSILN